jgi:hypothetical protein
MSVCLSATPSNRQKVEMSAVVCILFSLFLSIFYTNCVMPGPFCSLLFFLCSSSGYAKQECRENGDHHISHHIWCHYRCLYESTLDFFCWQARIVRSRSSLFVSNIFFFVFDMREREKKNQSYRFVYILDWPLLIQGHHIMFLLASYSFIQFAL